MTLWIVGGVVVLLGLAYPTAVRRRDDPPPQDNSQFAAAISLIIAGVASVAFPLTPWFENSGPDVTVLVLCAILGCLLIVVGVVVMFAGRERPPIAVYGVQIPLAVVPIILGVASLGFPYSPLYDGPTEPGIAYFTRPISGSEIPADKHFEVSGEVHDLPEGATLWLLVTSSQERDKDFYFSEYQPLVVSDDQVVSDERFSDIETYAPTAVGRKFFVVVQANRDCDNKIRETVSDPANSEKILRALPRGCQRIGELEFQIVN